MDIITGHEPAMPIFSDPVAHDGYGMTIRQKFAESAMQGLVASGFFTSPKLQAQAERIGCNISVALAVSAINIADELIKELNKEVTT